MTRLLHYLPFVGEPVVRRRLNEIFSRQLLGAVFVGAAAAKIIEKLIDLAYADTLGQLFAWSVTFVLAVSLFVWWERVERAAVDLAEGVVSEQPATVQALATAEEAFQEAEEAREVAERAESVAEAADAHATEAAEAATEADDRAAEAAADARQAEKKAREAAEAVEETRE